MKGYDRAAREYENYEPMKFWIECDLCHLDFDELIEVRIKYDPHFVPEYNQICPKCMEQLEFEMTEFDIL